MVGCRGNYRTYDPPTLQSRLELGSVCGDASAAVRDVHGEGPRKNEVFTAEGKQCAGRTAAFNIAECRSVGDAIKTPRPVSGSRVDVPSFLSISRSHRHEFLQIKAGDFSP